MAIRTIEEIMESIKNRIGEDTSDETLSFVEDVQDTLNNYSSLASDTTNWKQKYEDNDKEWRQKYRERFFNPEANKGVDNEPDNDDEDKPAVLTFDKLFKEE